MEAKVEYYKEQLAHGRHIEVQRSTIAGLALTISGAILGELLKRGSLSRNELPYTVTLFAVGTFSSLLCAKLYERFRLHNEVAKLVRNKIDPSLAGFRRRAERIIKKKFPILFPLRLHIVWNWLLAVIGIVGFAMTLKIWIGS